MMSDDLDANLDNAMAAHARWKLKFRAAIASREQMDVERISADHCCKLGQWLHGQGHGLYGSKPEFTQVLALHRTFHVEAGKKAGTINAQHYDQANQMLQSGTAFGHASSAVILAINALRQVV